MSGCVFGACIGCVCLLCVLGLCAFFCFVCFALFGGAPRKGLSRWQMASSSAE